MEGDNNRQNVVIELKIRACYIADYMTKAVKVEKRLGSLKYNKPPCDPMSLAHTLVDITHVWVVGNHEVGLGRRFDIPDDNACKYNITMSTKLGF